MIKISFSLFVRPPDESAMPPRASKSKATSEASTSKPVRVKKPPPRPPPLDPQTVAFVFDPARVRKVPYNDVGINLSSRRARSVTDPLVQSTKHLLDPGVDVKFTKDTIFDKSHCDRDWFIIYDLHAGVLPEEGESSRRLHNSAFQSRLMKTTGGSPDYWCQSTVYDSASGQVGVHLVPQWNQALRAGDPDLCLYWKSERATNGVSHKGVWFVSSRTVCFVEGQSLTRVSSRAAVQALPPRRTKLFKPDHDALNKDFLAYPTPNLDNIPTAPLSDIALYPCFVDRLIRLEEELKSVNAVIAPQPRDDDVSSLPAALDALVPTC